MQTNHKNVPAVLEMSLHDLGLTPQTGSALCSLIYRNDEDFEREAIRPRKCRGIQGQCGSCRSRPHECREILHHLPKMPAWRVLAKWSRFCKKKSFNFENGHCHIRSFLIPSLKNLLGALVNHGLTLEYIYTEIPGGRNILAFEGSQYLTPVGK